MKKYLETTFMGLGISAIAFAVYTAIYWKNSWFVIIVLAQGALQGLAAAVIYERIRLPYVAQFILHALISYLLALPIILYVIVVWKVTSLAIITFSFSWAIIFGIVFVYYHFKNRKTARKINKKLESSQ